MLEIFKLIPAGGTVFNSLAVIIGSLIGLAAGKFIPEKMRTTIFNCLGLFTCYVGINMTLAMKDPISVLLSLVLGAITGEFLGLEKKLNYLGDKLKAKFSANDSNFTIGFVNATILFCVGAMAIIGSINDGLQHDPQVLITKGVMDGVASMMMAGSYGIGVLFSAVSIFIYQGAFTVAASLIAPFITSAMYADISGLGGLMIIGIGLNMLNITKIKLFDMLPGVIYVIFFTMLFA